jgi:hypothetical protein
MQRLLDGSQRQREGSAIGSGPVDWIAAGIVFVCLVALAVDFGGRWGRPRLYLDFRNPLTYGVLGIIGAALALSLLTG